MQGSRAAARYAKALLNLSRERNQAKEVNQDMKQIDATIDHNSDLRVFLKSPVTKNSIKKNALQEIFSEVNDITQRLFEVLLENNRIKLLPLVASKYKELYDEQMGIQEAKVTTAVPLTPGLESRFQDKVKELTGKEAKIKSIVDESIIGGFILRVGDIQYNGSVKSQLNTLKREFTNKSYISKL